MFKLQQLFSFSLETEISPPTCLNILQTYPSFSLKEPYRKYLLIQSLAVDEKTNSFCLTIGHRNAPWLGAKAIGHLEAINNRTVVHAQIRTLAWKYLFFIPYLLFIPVFMLLIVSLLEFALIPIFLLFVGYIFPTVQYRRIAIEAVKERLTSKAPGT